MKLKKCLGVYISDTLLSVSHIENIGNKYKITFAYSEKIPLGHDEPEEVKLAYCAKKIKEIIKSKKITTRDAVFAISGINVFNRKRKLPNVPDRQLSGVVKYETAQIIPFPLDQIQVEFSPNRKPGATEIDVWIMAIKKDAVQNFLQKIRKIGLKIFKLEVSSVALYNFGVVDNSEYTEDQMVAFVDIGLNTIDISIGNQEGLGFTRSAPYAGNEIAKVLSKKLAISYDKAEEIRDNKIVAFYEGIEDEDIPEGYDKHASIEAKPVLERIVADVRRSIDFYISQPDGIAVETVILTGYLTRIPFIREFFEERLGIPTIIREELNEDKFEISEEISVKDTYIALSLAFCGVTEPPVDIDFLPPTLKDVRNLIENKLKVVIACAILFVNIGISLSFGNAEIKKINQATFQMQNEINQGKSMAEQYEKAKNELIYADKIVKFIMNFKKGDKFLEKSDLPLVILREINKKVPVDAMWISRFMFTEGKKIMILANAIDKDRFWKFFDAIRESEVIDPYVLSTREVDNKELGRKVTRYLISITIKEPEKKEEKKTPAPSPSPMPGRSRFPSRGLPGMPGMPAR